MVSVRRRIEGIPMILDREDRSVGQRLYVKGGREYAFMWLLRQQRGDLALDIGANIGYCTLSLARKFNKVIAFEPDDRNLRWLKKNINLNKLRNRVKLSPVAVSDKNGEKKLYIQTCSNLTSFEKNDGKPEVVNTITIDSLDIRPDFIKMDVEGHEVSVIRGAMETLKRWNCKVLMEVHPQYYSMENDMYSALQSLYSIGYRVTYMVNAKGQLDWFKKQGMKPFKTFKKYPKRALFKMATYDKKMFSVISDPRENEGKRIRAIMLEKV